MEQKHILMSAFGVGIGVGIVLASGHTVSKWTGGANPASNAVTPQTMEQEMLNLIVDCRDSKLIANAAYIGTPGKGILAADEFTGTIGKRLSTINVENNRRALLELLFCTPRCLQYLSGSLSQMLNFMDQITGRGFGPVSGRRGWDVQEDNEALKLRMDKENSPASMDVCGKSDASADQEPGFRLAQRKVKEYEFSGSKLQHEELTIMEQRIEEREKWEASARRIDLSVCVYNVEKEYMSEHDDTDYFMMQGIDQQVQDGECTDWESDEGEQREAADLILASFSSSL
ncbi:hypothetical protein ACET3Z_024908 [Daucus carota]